MNIAFLYPGQGAQYPGMGLDFYNSFPEAEKVFEQTAEVLGPDLVDVIFTGSEEKLRQTEYTQPAILAVSVAIYRVLERLGLKASAFAGLSLGEYSALVAAESISFEQALPLVQKRGIYMQETVPEGEGTMMAIMGLDHNVVEDLCRKEKGEGLVSPANYNCPGQIVISGHVEAVDKVVILAHEAGAKKITPLKVSAPFHCALLQPVEEKLKRELDKVKIKRPKAQVVFNATAAITSEPDQIKHNLIKQASNPIMWEQSIRHLLANGIDTFVSVGPGTSPGRLMKRIAPEMKTVMVDNVDDLDRLRAELL